MSRQKIYNEVTRVRIPEEEKRLLEEYAMKHHTDVSKILRRGYRQIIYERTLNDEDAGSLHKTYSLPTKKDGI